MPDLRYRQRLHGNYGLSFAISAALCAPLGWLAITVLVVIVHRALLHNEDGEAALYLLGIPLFVGMSFWIVARLGQFLYAQPVPQQTLLRSSLIAPILFYTLERATVLFLASWYTPSNIQFVGVISFLWTLTIGLCGMLLSWMRSTSIAAIHIRT
jgi:hypothetical protein